jgi:exonuclease III
VFDYLRKLNYNKDTHFTVDTENGIRNLWGYDCYFSSYTSNARGVAILFRNNFEFSVIRKKGDIEGNYLLLELATEDKKLLICCVYGPNNDSPTFFTKLQEHIDDFQIDNVIICGDFNLALNPEQDYYNYKNVNNPNARKKVIELIEDNDYVDVYRQFHPDSLRYTWRKKNPLKQSKVD